jgi:hypothetical protein
LHVGQQHFQLSEGDLFADPVKHCASLRWTERLAWVARDGPHGRYLHLVGDRRRAAVQRAPEDVREAQDVVDLIRVVGAPCGDHGVVANCADIFGLDLGRRIGKREDDRAGRHLADHRRLQHPAGRQAEKHVRTFDHIVQRARPRRLREAPLVVIHQLGASFVDDPGEIGDPGVAAAAGRA